MRITEIETDESLMELTQHGSKDFPLEYYYDEVKKYKIGCIPYHWHKEFELAVVTCGKVLYLVDNKEVILNEGEGIFVNSNVLHSIKEYDINNEVILKNIVFSPEFISSEHSRIFKKYVYPFVTSNISYTLLNNEVEWKREVIVHLMKIFNLCEKNEELYELKVQEEIMHIWQYLYKNLEEMQQTLNSQSLLISQGRLKQMIYYIEENYNNKIKLTNIAASANISTSEALRCFRENVDISPIKYLIQYRLHRAKKMLKETNKNISQIALECGFESVSYFNRMFRKEFNCTPKELKKNRD